MGTPPISESLEIIFSFFVQWILVTFSYARESFWGSEKRGRSGESLGNSISTPIDLFTSIIFTKEKKLVYYYYFFAWNKVLWPHKYATNPLYLIRKKASVEKFRFVFLSENRTVVTLKIHHKQSLSRFVLLKSFKMMPHCDHSPEVNILVSQTV